MKKLVLVLACAVLLAGCNAQDASVSISTASQSLNAKVASVKSYAQTLCAYVPTASTVISIFNSGMGTDVALVANAICNAVTTAPLADGGPRVPKVNGVTVHGKFVRR